MHLDYQCGQQTLSSCSKYEVESEYNQIYLFPCREAENANKQEIHEKCKKLIFTR